MNVSDAIRTKRAIRKFQEKPLTKEIITDNPERRTQIAVIEERADLAFHCHSG